PNRLAYGTILEARLDKGKGPVAAILVKNGSLKVGDPIVAGDTWGKVRAMQDEYKSNVKVATPSKAVEITGLDSVPCAGDRFMVFSDEKTARLVCEERKNRSVSESHKQEGVSLASLFQGEEDLKELNLIIKADLNGSLEAISNSLMKLDVAGAKINIVRGGVGAVTDTDISLAQVSHAIIVAFNVRSNSKLMDDAKSKGIEIRYYDIIYKFLEDVEKAMTGLLDPVFEEKVIGQAVVRQIYNISKVGTIAGAYVTSGLITRNCSVRLIRQGVVVHTGTLSTLKRFKDDVKEVKLGFECGIMLNNYNDVKIDDVIEGYIMSEVDRNAV
ncbi:MAG: translation initiation factor IF-2, partial [Bacilli bacterium]